MKHDALTLTTQVNSFLLPSHTTNPKKTEIKTVSSLCSELTLSRDELYFYRDLPILVRDPNFLQNPEAPFSEEELKELFDDFLKNSKHYDELSQVIGLALGQIEARISELALQGKIGYNIANFILKNDFDYKDKKESVNTNVNRNMSYNTNFDPKDFEHIEKIMKQNGFK